MRGTSLSSRSKKNASRWLSRSYISSFACSFGTARACASDDVIHKSECGGDAALHTQRLAKPCLQSADSLILLNHSKGFCQLLAVDGANWQSLTVQRSDTGVGDAVVLQL